MQTQNAKIEEHGNMQDTKTEMTTLSSVLEKLRVKKVADGFAWTPEGFTAGKGKVYAPDQLTILKNIQV